MAGIEGSTGIGNFKITLNLEDMKRALISQILKEWKVNVWLVFELIVVLAAIWFILLLIYGSTSGLLEPRGFDPENVYVLDIKTIQKSSP